MSWDAGSVSGRLEFDTSPLTEGVRLAESTLERLPPAFEQNIHAPLESIEPAAHEGFGGIGRELLKSEEIMELFPNIVSEYMASPILGFAGTVKEAFGQVKETISHTIDEGAETYFNSLKLGVPTEFLSQWTAVAQSVGLTQDSLVNGFFVLNERVGQAMEGSKEAQKGFGELGISMDWLKAHAGDTSAIFTEVEKRISAIPDPALRAAASTAVMGRGAREMGAMMSLSADDIQHVMTMQKKLGDVTDDAEGRQAVAAKRMENDWSMMAEGVEKSLSKGFMDELSKHTNEIEGDFTNASGSANEFGASLGKVATDSIPLLIAGLNGLDSLLKEVDGAMLQLPNMKSASDWEHLSIGGAPKWMGGDGLGSGINQQTMHNGPLPPRDAGRKQKEDFIQHEFGLRPTPDFSDADVEREYQQALDQQSGSRHSFPGSSDNASSSPSPSSASAPSPSTSPSKTADQLFDEQMSVMKRITSGKEHGDELRADNKRYDELREQESAAAKREAPQVRVTIGHMDVHLDKNSSVHGEIGKAIMGEVNKARKKAQDNANVAASVGGTP